MHVRMLEVVAAADAEFQTLAPASTAPCSLGQRQLLRQLFSWSETLAVTIAKTLILGSKPKGKEGGVSTQQRREVLRRLSLLHLQGVHQ